MSEERPRFEPGLVLAQVSLRVFLPMLGGAIIGLVADAIGQTSPQFALIGLGGGTLVSILWLRGFIASNMRRIRGSGEEHEQTTIERNR